MRDLPRIVADTPVGKEVDVVVIRKGKEETHQVKLGRLEDGEKAASHDRQARMRRREQKSVVQKTLGLELSSHVRRSAQEIQDQGHHQGRGRHRCRFRASASAAPDKRLAPGDVIVEVQYEAVGNPADLQTRARCAQGARARRSRCCWSPTRDGETRFVALSLQ